MSVKVSDRKFLQVSEQNDEPVRVPSPSTYELRAAFQTGPRLEQDDISLPESVSFLDPATNIRRTGFKISSFKGVAKVEVNDGEYLLVPEESLERPTSREARRNALSEALGISGKAYRKDLSFTREAEALSEGSPEHVLSLRYDQLLGRPSEQDVFTLIASRYPNARILDADDRQPGRFRVIATGIDPIDETLAKLDKDIHEAEDREETRDRNNDRGGKPNREEARPGRKQRSPHRHEAGVGHDWDRSQGNYDAMTTNPGVSGEELQSHNPILPSGTGAGFGYVDDSNADAMTKGIQQTASDKHAEMSDVEGGEVVEVLDPKSSQCACKGKEHEPNCPKVREASVHEAAAVAYTKRDTERMKEDIANKGKADLAAEQKAKERRKMKQPGKQSIGQNSDVHSKGASVVRTTVAVEDTGSMARPVHNAGHVSTSANIFGVGNLPSRRTAQSNTQRPVSEVANVLLNNINDKQYDARKMVQQLFGNASERMVQEAVSGNATPTTRQFMEQAIRLAPTNAGLWKQVSKFVMERGVNIAKAPGEQYGGLEVKPGQLDPVKAQARVTQLEAKENAGAISDTEKQELQQLRNQLKTQSGQPQEPEAVQPNQPEVPLGQPFPGHYANKVASRTVVRYAQVDKGEDTLIEGGMFEQLLQESERLGGLTAEIEKKVNGVWHGYFRSPWLLQVKRALRDINYVQNYVHAVMDHTGSIEDLKKAVAQTLSTMIDGDNNVSIEALMPIKLSLRRMQQILDHGYAGRLAAKNDKVKTKDKPQEPFAKPVKTDRKDPMFADDIHWKTVQDPREAAGNYPRPSMKEVFTKMNMAKIEAYGDCLRMRIVWDTDLMKGMVPPAQKQTVLTFVKGVASQSDRHRDMGFLGSPRFLAFDAKAGTATVEAASSRAGNWPKAVVETDTDFSNYGH